MAHAGRRVATLFTVGVWALASVARGQPPAPAIPPDTRITLERHGCGGPCPHYRVTVDGRGTVVYEGMRFVRVEGTQTARVSTRVVADLLDAARQIGFFDLSDGYRSVRDRRGREVFVTDLEQSFLTITSGGRTKRIEDYVGTPDALRQLERRIDDVTRTRRWTNIDPPMLASLRAAGRMPPPERLGELLENAVIADDAPTVTALLAAGADPNIGHMWGPGLLGAGSARTVRALLDGGADPLIRTDDGRTALHQAAHLEPEVTARLLEAGVPVDSPTLQSRTPLMEAACAGNAPVVAILLAAGANPAATSDGTTPLSCAEDARTRQDDWIPTPGLWLVPDYDRVIASLRAALAAR